VEKMSKIREIIVDRLIEYLNININEQTDFICINCSHLKLFPKIECTSGMDIKHELNSRDLDSVCGMWDEKND